MKKTKLVKNQKKIFTYEIPADDGEFKEFNVTVRYDDQCNNGHNSFSITTDSGCNHDSIRKFAPELSHLIKWHFMTSEGPLHYIENTIYLAGNVDYDNNKKGQYTRYTTNVMANITFNGTPVNIYSTGTMYHNRQGNLNLAESNTKEIKDLEKFCSNISVPYEQVILDDLASAAEGKDSDLEAARRSAIWPDAELWQLQDKNLLEKRLPKLKEDFIKDIESDLLGFTF